MNTSQSPPGPEAAPFTAFADLDPLAGESSRFSAPNPPAAAQITEQLLLRDPGCRARWGPTTSPDGQPWPVPVFVRHQVAFDEPAGEVHIALLAAGETVGAELHACCGTAITYRSALFTRYGPACPQCLTYWHIAYGHPPPDGADDAVHSNRWATIDHELLSRLLTALRNLPNSQGKDPHEHCADQAHPHVDTPQRTDDV
ncbi:hypothetical protein [Haloactinomyces albus]|uniref:Uncharacterized protein n=1 Tax=Haloactinomyces albus TaxID=1352928 RepID=A0AAE3ZH63_9ACTN|nr:hypothetical protein [Haloactinomyces albus]MDR7303514.1 hypothetical protein [Haloactinomyces albus]